VNARDKLTKAKAGLVLQSPFFASLILRLPMVEDSTCETMWINGIKIGYNPGYIDSLPLDEVKGILCHEALHVTNCHHTREQNREHAVWNKACDYAINPVVEDSGHKLPDVRLRDSRFEGKEAEKIYSEIYDGQKGDSEKGKQSQSGQQGQDSQNNNPDPGGCGEVRKFPGESGTPSPAQIKQEEQNWKVAVQQAANVAKAQGKLPGVLERLVRELLEPQIPWKEVLARFLTENVKNDYNWRLPNRRFVHMGLYLPQLNNPELGQVVLYIDTSGSIGQSEMDMMAGEIQGILSRYDVELQVVYVDSEVQGTQKVTRDDVPVNLKPKGGGGTDYLPGFLWVEEKGIEPAVAVYLTDGYCNSFPEEPGYPVLWALTNGHSNWNPPFGETLQIRWDLNNNE